MREVNWSKSREMERKAEREIKQTKIREEREKVEQRTPAWTSRNQLTMHLISGQFIKKALVPGVHKSSLPLQVFDTLTMTYDLGASLVTQMVRNLPARQETQIRSLGQEDPLQKEMATHSSIFAWRIPWTGELGGLHFRGMQRHDWSDLAYIFDLYPSLILHSFKDIEELLFNGILHKIGKYLGHQMWETMKYPFHQLTYCQVSASFAWMSYQMDSVP